MILHLSFHQTFWIIFLIKSKIFHSQASKKHKMVVNGLPVALETTLNALTSEHDLSSWQIRGGMEYTQVTLRFSIGLKDPSQADIQQYRRMSEYQILRNRDGQPNGGPLMDYYHQKTIGQKIWII